MLINITAEQVKQAKAAIKECQKIIDEYNAQQKQIANAKQKEREDNCGEHYFIPTNAKWQSAGQMQCCHCGKIID